MRRRVVCVVAALVLGATALSAEAGAAPKKQPPLRILVTNDDGYAAPGIDALVEALRKVPGVKVTVIAPAENKTATGSSTTPGPLATTPVRTASGYPAVAVAGFPADTVIYALEQGGLAKKPNLVMSGINTTQNLGETGVKASGTVGAARAAAQRGVPALAVSLGLRRDAIPLDYASSAKEALRWLKQHRKALLPKKGAKVKPVLDNLNIPTCVTGELRGTVEVPLAAFDVAGAGDLPNCESTLEHPKNDIEAFQNGFATISELPIPATP